MCDASCVHHPLADLYGISSWGPLNCFCTLLISRPILQTVLAGWLGANKVASGASHPPPPSPASPVLLLLKEQTSTLFWRRRDSEFSWLVQLSAR